FLIVKLPSSVSGNSTQELLQFMGELHIRIAHSLLYLLNKANSSFVQNGAGTACCGKAVG
uniref:hypothetical protein n=1 Tax=Pseudoalteromonas rubra TaxID=43658 RepID=UPI00197DCE5B